MLQVDPHWLSFTNNFLPRGPLLPLWNPSVAPRDMALLLFDQHARVGHRPPQKRVFRARTHFLNFPLEVVLQRYHLHPALI